MKKENLIIFAASAFLVFIGVFSLRKMKQNNLDRELEKNQELDLGDGQLNINNSTESQSMPATLSANKSLSKPEMQISNQREYLVSLDTSEGKIVIKLKNQETPITANNFVYLARQGFYDGTIFHRAIDGFMIQGGDPRGDGTGGPGYRFDDEEFTGEYTRGTVAMANAGPNTNGSQFFIMHQDYPLPPNYVIFGQVIEGLEVVDKIATAPVQMSLSGENSQPVEPVMIEAVSVEEK